MTQESQAVGAAPQARPENQQQRQFYFRPHVDIIEEAAEYVLLADMPGSSEENIEIEFNDGLLTLHAKVPPRHPEHREYILQQYEVGDYRRSFRIDETVDASKITAEYADGVLRVHLPKSEKRKPRKIAVSGS